MKSQAIFDGMRDLHDAFRDYFQRALEGSFNLKDFALWLYNRESAEMKSSGETTDQSEPGNIYNDIDDRISFILLNMQKLIKFYIKKALEGTQLVGIDDIHFLMFLAETESMKKSEIINSNLTEMSSGIEVINRLLKKGFIEDFDDQDDRRSKRVRITQKGLGEMGKVTSKFRNLHSLLGSAINDDEKFGLLSVLSRIYNFHINIYNNEKNESLEELFRKYLHKGENH
jgi:MarR family transcriptional regulator, lower aerobic nicotinate degradation pathway regulator